ncbi:hypothetical protein [Pseudoalteromonas luteoviolacea]|uniref:hypothetical protein n=1 Tax=Pseudoalteromonas luteoviolacea TaxID=43657 RepID=UPI001B37A2BB|nr:hypothetical protein [Pseudoalteromonas luteoviolacea]MBQ4838805.1 hypothetical protein [Pseudoalteromonas luteoviolacea]
MNNKLTQEQIKKIIDNAPEGATHFFNNDTYAKFVDSGETSHYKSLAKDGGLYPIKFTQSLDDLKTIQLLRERIDKALDIIYDDDGEDFDTVYNIRCALEGSEQ